MLSPKEILTESAHVAEEVWKESSLNDLDRKCMVVRRVVKDGDFDLQKALELYEITVDQYLDFLTRETAREIQCSMGIIALNPVNLTVVGNIGSPVVSLIGNSANIAKGLFIANRSLHDLYRENYTLQGIPAINASGLIPTPWSHHGSFISNPAMKFTWACEFQVATNVVALMIDGIKDTDVVNAVAALRDYSEKICHTSDDSNEEVPA